MTSPTTLYWRGLWHIIGLVLIAIVWYLSLTSAPIRVDVPQFDKVMHALAYFIQMTWYSQLYQSHKQKFLIAGLFISMGILIEYIQSFHPMRYLDIADMLANTTGVGLAYALSYTPLGRSLVWFDQKLSRRLSSKKLI